ncbi:MAG: methyltransferase [Pseudomonadota bacterium]
MTLETGQRATETSQDAVQDTTRDAFLGGAVWLNQPRKGYRAGLDAVLLAATVAPRTTAEQTKRIADLGAGAGAVGLCVAGRIGDATVDMVERDAALANLARRNIAENACASRVRLLEGDVRNGVTGSGLQNDLYDHVLANPPYFVDDASRASTLATKAASHVWAAGDLESWARCMARIAKPGGTVTLIHPAESLADWLNALTGRFGAFQVVPIHARPGTNALRVLIRAQKSSRAGLLMRPPVILHGEQGDGFRPEVDRVLKQPAALDVWSD